MGYFDLTQTGPLATNTEPQSAGKRLTGWSIRPPVTDTHMVRRIVWADEVKSGRHLKKKGEKCDRVEVSPNVRTSSPKLRARGNSSVRCFGALF